MDSQTPPFPPAKKTNWWLLGCGGCLSLIVLGVIGCGVLFFGVMKLVKSSEAYQMALSAATNSPEVQAELGAPIQPGMMVQGNVNSNAGTETADLSIPLKGPKASATVHFFGKKADGKWEISDFTVTVAGSGKTISLNPAH